MEVPTESGSVVHRRPARAWSSSSWIPARIGRPPTWLERTLRRQQSGQWTTSGLAGASWTPSAARLTGIGGRAGEGGGPTQSSADRAPAATAPFWTARRENVASGGQGRRQEPAQLLQDRRRSRSNSAHAVVDPVHQGILQAHVGLRAGAADPPGAVDADAIAREERGRRMVPAVPFVSGGLSVIFINLSSSVGGKLLIATRFNRKLPHRSRELVCAPPSVLVPGKPTSASQALMTSWNDPQ